MVDVRYEPFREIIILSRARYSVEDFIRTIGLVSGSGVVQWAEGLVFTHHVLPWGETTIKEAVNGRLYWSHVTYAELPTYKPVLESKDGRIKLAVVDASYDETMKEAVKRLKVLDRLSGFYKGERRPLRVIPKPS